MAITQVVVSATYKNPDATNATGTVDFVPLTPLQNSGSNIIVSGKTTATLSSGAISVTLYATDDTDTDPDGALYEVTERITGVDERSYLIELPNTGNVNLADITPATDMPYTSYATAASVVGIGTGKVDKTGDSMTGDLAMGSNKVTGLAAATATGHAARWDEAVNYAPTDGRQAAATVKAGVEELVDLGLLGVLTNKRALRRFLKDAPVAATAVKKVVVLGDSIAEGALAATDPGGVSTGGWVQMLGQRLAAASPGNTADYGIGWIGIKTSQLPGTFDVDQGATGTHGLGERGTVLDGTDYCEHTEACDAISVFYTAGTGTFTVRIDGTLVATIDSSLATGTGTQWTSSALSYGNHTVKVQHSSGTSSLIDAVLFHRGNATTGWQVHNGGHSGYTADDVTAGSIAHIDKHDPSLVIIHMGTNDYSAGSSTFATNLAALVASVQAVVTSSILLVVPHASSGRTSTQWDPFRRAVYSTAVTYGCAVVDCYDVMGDSSDAVDIISQDNVHPNGRGHQMIADAIFDSLGIAARERRITHAQHLFSELGDVTITDTAALEDGELVRMDGDGNIVRGYLQSPDLISSIVSALYLPIFSGDTVINRRGFANGIFGMVTTDPATGLQVTLGVGGLAITNDDTGYVEMEEITAPSAPSANSLRLYTVDDGGVTKLATRVNGGSSSPLATEAVVTAADAVVTAASVQKSLVDAKGDLLAASAADTVARVAVGTDGQVLRASSSASAGVGWSWNIGPAIPPGVNDYFGSPHVSRAAGVLVASRQFYTPIWVDQPITVDRIAAEVTTTSANDLLRLGIYNHNYTTHRPSTVLLDAGTVDGGSGTFKEITISQTLSPGIYWLSAASQGAGAGAAQWRRIATAAYPQLPSTGPNGSTALYAYYQSSITGAFATASVAAGGATTNCPVVWLRRSV